MKQSRKKHSAAFKAKVALAALKGDEAAVGLALFEGNWVHPLRALREWAPEGRRWYRQRTPAMAIGLTDHVWSWQEFLTTPTCHFLRQ